MWSNTCESCCVVWCLCHGQVGCALALLKRQGLLQLRSCRSISLLLLLLLLAPLLSLWGPALPCSTLQLRSHV